MKNKKSFRISIRANQRQFTDLVTFAKLHKWSTSEALRHILNNVSAHIELKAPSKAFVQQVPAPIIASNAKTITAMNRMYGTAYNTYQDCDALRRTFIRFATILGNKKMSHYVEKVCEQAFNLIGEKLEAFTLAAKLLYKQLDNMEKNFDYRKDDNYGKSN